MNERIEELARRIRELEKELRQEVQRIRIDTYEIRGRTIRFRKEVARRHRSQMRRLLSYLRHARLRHVISVPVIWLCLLPALFMDLVVNFYQAVCFPLYGIPKARRRDYVVMDRHNLKYLNVIEKINCLYCGYFNGVIAFTREVGARTEQYWCPIKHAANLKEVHSRYHRFMEFGDADTYESEVEVIRRAFDDVRKEKEKEGADA
ncbi:MAG: hypothetical protein ACQETO_05385 [Pseudomonadota bacterium]